jgi:phage replication O-like protein O
MKGNPQIEDGFVRIATELFEALCRTSISPSARRVFDAIIRKTYGFGKKADNLSISQLMAITDLPERAVCRSLRTLLGMNLIIKLEPEIGMNRFSINKKYKTWELTKKTEAKMTEGTNTNDSGKLMSKPTVISGSKPLSEMPDTIDTLTKDIFTKERGLVKNDEENDETVDDMEELHSTFVMAVVESEKCNTDVAFEIWDKGLLLPDNQQLEFLKKVKMMIRAAKHSATLPSAKRFFRQIQAMVDNQPVAT